MERKIHPIIQITHPKRDKSKETNANGSPIKKPNGLHWQSPIFLDYLSLFCNFLL